MAREEVPVRGLRPVPDRLAPFLRDRFFGHSPSRPPSSGAETSGFFIPDRHIPHVPRKRPVASRRQAGRDSFPRSQQDYFVDLFRTVESDHPNFAITTILGKLPPHLLRNGQGPLPHTNLDGKPKLWRMPW